MGVPQIDSCIMNNPMKMDDLGRGKQKKHVDYQMVGKLQVAPTSSPLNREYLGNMDTPNTPFIAPSKPLDSIMDAVVVKKHVNLQIYHPCNTLW